MLFITWSNAPGTGQSQLCFVSSECNNTCNIVTSWPPDIGWGIPVGCSSCAVLHQGCVRMLFGEALQGQGLDKSAESGGAHSVRQLRPAVKAEVHLGWAQSSGPC